MYILFNIGGHTSQYLLNYSGVINAVAGSLISGRLQGEQGDLKNNICSIALLRSWWECDNNNGNFMDDVTRARTETNHNKKLEILKQTDTFYQHIKIIHLVRYQWNAKFSIIP